MGRGADGPGAPAAPGLAPELAAHREKTVALIAEWYRADSEYGTDGVSQLDHACQAALQARKAGYPDPVMVGALLHDIGWKLATADPRMSCGEMSEVYEQTPDAENSVAARLGILAVIGADHGMAAGQQRAQHDVIGATFLRMHGFDERCARLVEGHVLAKRYLCFAEPGYYDILSAGSKTTLKFQGGPMSAEEAKLFEADPYFDLYKTMRRWDEGAKDVDCEPIPFEHFLPVIAEQIQHLPCTAAEATARATFARVGNVIKGVRSRFAVPDSFRLTAEDRRMWTEEGYVVLRGWLSPENVGAMLQYVEEVQAGIEGPLYQYEEGVGGQTVPARTEDFIDYHAGMAELLRNDGPLAAVVADLVGEDVSIYKEKINYKLPGGGGYKAHQDGYRGLGVPQGPYEFMAYVCMIAADNFTVENGCPELSPEVWAKKEGVLPGHARVAGHYMTEDDIHKEGNEGFDFQGADAAATPVDQIDQWRHCPMQRGDVLIYDNYMPHKSGINASPNPRRALFAIYNKAAQGDFHKRYYDNERQNRRAAGSAVIKGAANSFFTGKPVLAAEE